jgi:hypothetical protein
MKFEMILNLKKVTVLCFDILTSFGGEWNEGLVLSFHTTPGNVSHLLASSLQTCAV